MFMTIVARCKPLIHVYEKREITEILSTHLKHALIYSPISYTNIHMYKCMSCKFVASRVRTPALGTCILHTCSSKMTSLGRHMTYSCQLVVFEVEVLEAAQRLERRVVDGGDLILLQQQLL